MLFLLFYFAPFNGNNMKHIKLIGQLLVVGILLIAFSSCGRRFCERHPYNRHCRDRGVGHPVFVFHWWPWHRYSEPMYVYRAGGPGGNPAAGANQVHNPVQSQSAGNGQSHLGSPEVNTQSDRKAERTGREVASKPSRRSSHGGSHKSYHGGGHGHKNKAPEGA